MKRSCLITTMTLATITLSGCTGGTTTGQTDASTKPDASVQPDASTKPDASVSELFELQGAWLYLGPWEAQHTLKISNASAVYNDVDGAWTSNWTIKDYDNKLHRFQLVFASGTGTYSPTGTDFSGTYELSGAILTVQLASGLGSYAPLESPGSCTDEGSNRLDNCGLYMKQN